MSGAEGMNVAEGGYDVVCCARIALCNEAVSNFVTTAGRPRRCLVLSASTRAARFLGSVRPDADALVIEDRVSFDFMRYRVSALVWKASYEVLG